MAPVLILGSRLIDGRPGSTLQRRLTAALPYISDHVVVSGHQGEAEAMRDWLISHGVPSDVITVENQARSTNENLEQAFTMLKGYPRWTVVTSDFHAWRTKMWAWHHGLTVDVVTARTPLSKAPKMWIREAFALPHSLARIVWRRVKDSGFGKAD
ncbi:YdcF family protein [Corynebacterium hindlerae]|uniref:YdcF family protein n=1 Tax=Corynebacterium hindlerae TaxID=699041 RepID=A0A7G5FH85_9CORY|nr:YdcF family protein [Corynebacterium hindlerae]QMV85976.1 YdcF family protein [Corynebacterium hindlerae]